MSVQYKQIQVSGAAPGTFAGPAGGKLGGVPGGGGGGGVVPGGGGGGGSGFIGR